MCADTRVLFLRVVLNIGYNAVEHLFFPYNWNTPFVFVS